MLTFHIFRLDEPTLSLSFQLLHLITLDLHCTENPLKSLILPPPPPPPAKNHLVTCPSKIPFDRSTSPALVPLASCKPHWKQLVRRIASFEASARTARFPPHAPHTTEDQPGVEAVERAIRGGRSGFATRHSTRNTRHRHRLDCLLPARLNGLEPRLTAAGGHCCLALSAESQSSGFGGR